MSIAGKWGDCSQQILFTSFDNDFVASGSLEDLWEPSWATVARESSPVCRYGIDAGLASEAAVLGQPDLLWGRKYIQFASPSLRLSQHEKQLIFILWALGNSLCSCWPWKSGLNPK